LLQFIFLTVAIAKSLDDQSSIPGKYRVIETQHQQIHILEIDPKHYKIVAVRASDEKGARETVSALVKERKALAGINGGFFHLDEDSQASPAGALKIQGTWLGVSKLPRAAIGWSDDSNAIVDRIITRKKVENNQSQVQVSPQIDKSQLAQQKWSSAQNVVGGVGLLIKQGKPIQNHQSEKTMNTFLYDRHARTAICMNKQKHWVFVVASHTKAAAKPYVNNPIQGLTIAELTKLMHQIGCQDSINLDGGGSSVLVLNDEVVNDCAGDMDDIVHIYHERPVYDAILVFPREKSEN
jgi:exopolysaccharide biosynthesis protein